MIMHNLNNFPENRYEMSGAKLLVSGIALLLVGSGLGALTASKMIDRKAVKDYVEMQNAVPPKESARTFFDKWKYPNATDQGQSLGDDVVQSIVTTDDSFETVQKYYTKRFGYGEDPLHPTYMPSQPNNVTAGEMPPNPSGFSGRGISLGEHLATFTGSSKDHSLALIIERQDNKTQIVTQAARMRQK